MALLVESNPKRIRTHDPGREPCGQSYKATMIVNYDPRVIPDWKIPHIMTLDS